MKNCSPYIERYMEMVEKEEVRTCKEIKALVVLIRRCFLEEDIYVDEEQLENYLGLSKYFPYEKIFEWQQFVIALHDCTYWRGSGMPRWSDLFCMIGRGAGKDGTIALESMALTSPYNGIREYDVDICANNEEQAMRPVQDIIAAFEQPKWIKKIKRFFYWTVERVKCVKTNSVIRGRTNNPKGKDGLRSGIVIFNEIHQYEDYKNINVFTTGLGKKKHPRRSYYTTQGDIREGPLDDLLETAEGILFRGDPDDGLLPFINRLDSKEEVHEEANWEKANPSLPYLPDLKEEIRKEYKTWLKSPYQLPAFMTKRMNIPEGQQERQVTDWENIKATNQDIPDVSGCSCICGIDLSMTTDWAAVNLHFKLGETRIDINHAWMCLNNKEVARLKCPWRKWETSGLLTVVDDVEIHPQLLTDYIQKMKLKYRIQKVCVDDFRYTLLSYYLGKIGFDVKDKKNVKLVKGTDIMKISPVIDRCFVNHFFVWGDNPVLRWATNNTKLIPAKKRQGQQDADIGNYTYGKIEAKSRKTDPFMAVVFSMTAEDEIKSSSRKTPDIGVFSY